MELRKHNDYDCQHTNHGNQILKSLNPENPDSDNYIPSPGAPTSEGRLKTVLSIPHTAHRMPEVVVGKIAEDFFFLVEEIADPGQILIEWG